MSSIRSAILRFCSLATLTSAALAAPVQYDIHFVQTHGSSTQSGSFFYDSAASSFSQFIVTFNGQMLDFTSAANSATSIGKCGVELQGATLGFAIMAGTTKCLTQQAWVFFGSPAGNPEVFFASDSAFQPDTSKLDEADRIARVDPAGQVQYNDGGTFTISQAVAGAVPEPQSVALFGLGMVALAIGRRRSVIRSIVSSPVR